MKIYVVTHTEYPMCEGETAYFTVRKAFKDETKADEYAKRYDCDVEEVELE